MMSFGNQSFSWKSLLRHVVPFVILCRSEEMCNLEFENWPQEFWNLRWKQFIMCVHPSALWNMHLWNSLLFVLFCAFKKSRSHIVFTYFVANVKRNILVFETLSFHLQQLQSNIYVERQIFETKEVKNRAPPWLGNGQDSVITSKFLERI